MYQRTFFAFLHSKFQKSTYSSTISYYSIPNILGKSNSRGSSPESTGIRRTASLDTVYLKGQWPRDGPYWFSDILQKDKATQVGSIFQMVLHMSSFSNHSFAD